MKEEIKQPIDLLVIGGGAAGMMSAGVAAQAGRHVVLVEKNPILGKKLRITGKGRCNITNDCDRDTFMEHILHNRSFLYSAYHAFSSQDTMRFFEQLGVPLKVERGRRVFPVSDDARQIAESLAGFCTEQGVQILHAAAVKLLAQDGRIKGVVCADGRKLTCTRLVLATGGMSYPATGSTGDGLRFAKEIGHPIVKCRPSLVPIELTNHLGKDLQGLSLKNVELVVRQPGKKRPVFKQRGEMLFTHFGISGSLVLSASSVMEEDTIQNYKLLIDLKPALTCEQIDRRICREIRQHPAWECKRLIYGFVPKRLGDVIAQIGEIQPFEKIGQMKRETRQWLTTILKDFPLPVKRFRPLAEAIITAGGIDTSMVDPKTMESKLCKGLYFAGEMLDVDGWTGGYNLQIAWSTGYVAGKSIAAAGESG